METCVVRKTNDETYDLFNPASITSFDPLVNSALLKRCVYSEEETETIPRIFPVGFRRTLATPALSGALSSIAGQSQNTLTLTCKKVC